MKDSEIERLEFLAMLPMLLNSSLNPADVLRNALSKVRNIIDAEAATIFTLDSSGGELSFWGLEGGSDKLLEGKKIPLGQGIVGWVVREQRSIHIPDVKSDTRFFGTVDREARFLTRDLLCSPLTVGSGLRLGAIEVLNSKKAGGFTEEDLNFLDKFSYQLSFALYNAKLYENLVEKSKSLAILDKRKNEAMTVIAHEFRTPLAIIQGAADVLIKGNLKDQAAHKRMGDALDKGVERLARLVSRVKDLSVVSAEKLEIRKRAIDVADLFERLQSYFAEVLKRRKINLKIEIEPELPKVKADGALVFLVFRELIANAIRFTPDGGEINLEASSALGFVNFCVKDSGIGMEPSQLEVIFEKFYEVGDAMRHSSGEYEFKSSGLGLGLALVKAALNAHAASIQAVSEVEKGSAFTFALESA